MNRREFIAIAGGAIAWPLEGLSQQASRTYRVAYLGLGWHRRFDVHKGQI